MRQKIAERIQIKEAMENLAAIASINLESPPPIGIIQETRLVTNAEESESNDIRWLSSEGADVLLNVLDMTYRSVLHHLQNLYEHPSIDWESKKSQDGISAMMSLVGESAQKMDHYLEYRLDKPLSTKVEESRSFKDLQKFYSEKFAKKVSGGVEGKEAWERSWYEKHSLLKNTGSQLKDFEALLRDKEYELFFIANENGEPYLNENLLRNLKLTVDFDVESKEFEEDPFLKVRSMQDRDLQATAAQVLHECKEEIAQFYKITKSVFQYTLAKILSQSILALFLASNARHLLQRTTGKHSSQYFDDFHHFLREACKSPEYQKWIAYPPPKSDKDANLLLFLVHKLWFSLICRSGGVKQEAIGLIHRTARRGKERDSKEKGETIWSQFLLEDENLRSLFRKYPSGPLLKTLDFVRKEQEEGALTPFDPWIQGNLPGRLFTIQKGKKEVPVLRFACPTRQSTISRVEIIDEFRGFLRHRANEKKGGKHLLINLQDRLSWRENARSWALEQLQNNQSFSSQLVVLTLPKDTDFYHQKGAFEELNKTDAFIKAFKEQLFDPVSGGFFFPSQWKKEEILKFADSALSLIHQHIFEGKNTLPRQRREDFIEIFYQLLIVKAVDLFGADSLGFTCKDALDTGAFASGIFYGFLKLLQGDLSSKEDIDFLKFLFYWPALSIRERASDPEQFFRSISMLECLSLALEERGSKIVKAFGVDLRVP